MSFDSPEPPKTPALPTIPDAPAAPPIFGLQQSPGKKPKSGQSAPTFLGLGSLPTNLGNKTLLGM